MRESANRFFSSKVSKMGIRVIICLLEYIILSRVINILPQYAVSTIILIGYVLIMYAVYYWVTQKHSSEYYIYTLIILEFVFNKLNQEQVFSDLFKCPFWVLYIALFICFFTRIFIIEKVYHFFRDIYLGFLDSKRENLNQKIAEITERQQELAKEKAERTEYIIKRSLSRRQFWAKLRDSIIDFIYGIVDFIVAIPSGIFSKRTSRKKDGKIKEEVKPPQSNKVKMPMWVKVVLGIIMLFFIALFWLLLYYQIFLSPTVVNETNGVDILNRFAINLSNNNNLIELASKIVMLFLIDVIVLVFLIIMAFTVFVVVIQIIKSGHRMIEDLLKSIENKSTGTDHSSIVFYSVIVFIICLFVNKLYPFKIDDLAELLYNGSFIIFPVMMAVFIPIITMIIDLLKSNTISNFLNSERAEEIKELFAGLALGTLKAILNYLTFVTKDFLLTIQELTIDEFNKPKESGEGNNDENNVNTNGNNNTCGTGSGSSDNTC